MAMRRNGDTWNYNFRSRGKSYFESTNAPLNQQVLSRIYGRLHYLASHAPVKVSKQWIKADTNFRQVHYGFGNQSVRYANTWTMHSWT